jgi:hypothetical protein
MTEAVPDRWAAWDDAEPPPPPPPEGEARRPEMPDLPSFVRWLTSTWRRKTGKGRAWCPDWWAHAEAIDVLEGLWRTWEQLRLPEHAAFGRATFWRDWAYPLLRELTAEDGPFLGCSVANGHAGLPLQALKLSPPPAGMFTPEDTG